MPEDTDTKKENVRCPDCPLRPGKCSVCGGIMTIQMGFGRSTRCINCDALGNCPTCKGSGKLPA